MRLRFTLWATIVTVPAISALIALGVWQLERRAWKHDLLSRIETAANAAPRDLVAVLAGPEADKAYAKVEADGRITPDTAAHLFAPVEAGQAAYRVIAPLDYGDGRVILVDFGTITEIEKARLGDAVPPGLKGDLHVEGILRPSEPAGMFTPATDLKANRWYARDTAAIAAALSLGPIPAFMIQSETPNPLNLPRAIPFRPELADNHLAYAFTWFSLALILAVVYVVFHTRRRDD